ncbi:putative tubby protein [Monocercomonoides exilis]|uniref:putative tubby protein n=1 Tax=Monocercomonoides exilis TaxID=2049356 RepID=UPI003559B2EB|nr:putative tubby protein [Monocercomonoides exilis]
MEGTDPSSVALQRLLNRKSSILELEGFSYNTTNFTSPYSEATVENQKIKMNPLFEGVSVISSEDSPFTSLTLPQGVGTLQITSIKRHGKDKKSVKLEIADSGKSDDKLVLGGDLPGLSVERTRLVEKGGDSKAGDMNVIGGIGQISGVPFLDFSDMTRFLICPLPRGVMAECVLIRKKGLFPKYEMLLEKENLFLMASKKESNNYLISSVSSDISKTSSHYLGKMKVLMMSDTYVMYGKGRNPKTHIPGSIVSSSSSVPSMAGGKSGQNQGDILSSSLLREEMGCISYESDGTALKQLKLYIPRVTEDGTRICIRPHNPADGILALKQKPGSLIPFISRKPQKDPMTKKFQMDFHGRAKVASIKNHQLIPGTDSEKTEEELPTFFQFGKIDVNKFCVDFAFPFSPFQAFCIALSIFDVK